MSNFDRLNASEVIDAMDAERRYRRDLEAEIQRLREREAHFARVLSVADGGQYRNDWDGAIRRVLDERDRLRTALLSVAAFSKHPHPAPCGTDSCVLCLIESTCAEALGDSA